MRRLARSLSAAAALALPSLLSPSASADLPPPDGVKHVDFAVSVDNLAAFPDVVVVAYPWSLSNGAPTTEHAVLRDGQPLEIGRRSAEPKLWAVKKADYDAFAAQYEPTRSFQDAPLEAFFKSGKAIACDAAVAPEHQLPAGDSRDRIVQALRAEVIDATRCHLVAAGEGSAAKAGASPPAIAGGEPPRESAPAAGSGGCAGCAASSSGAERYAAVSAMAITAIAVLARRRRR